MTIAPPSPPFIAARWHGGDQVPKVVVMHGTVSPCIAGGARSVARFFASEDNKTSAHYVRDPLETIQCVRDHTVAFHCGHNQDSIGYELCDPQAGAGSRWVDRAHSLMLTGAAKDVARLCLAYKIPPVKIGPADLKAGKRGICGHADETIAFRASTHTDPGASFPWPVFIGMVKSEIAKLMGDAVDKTPAVPLDHLHLINTMNDSHELDLNAAESLQKSGKPPYAAAANDLHDAVVAAFDKYRKATGAN